MSQLFLDIRIRERISIRDQWASQLARWSINIQRESLGSGPFNPPGTDPPDPDTPRIDPSRIGSSGICKPDKPLGEAPGLLPGRARQGKNVYDIGIIGAGAAGLFTALVLEHINFEMFKQWIQQQGASTGVKRTSDDELLRKYSPEELRNPTKNPGVLHFAYEILEANGPDRLGGRLFTYNFGGPRDAHDYYDVGGMRFPDSPIMTRVFDLFKRLGMEKTDLKTNPEAKDGSIIPYYMTNGDKSARNIEPWCYNDITLWGDWRTFMERSKDPFEMTGLDIPDDIRINTPSDIIEHAVDPLREALKKDVEQDPPGHKGWDLLMQYDKLSTRGFLSMKPPLLLPPSSFKAPPYTFDTIEWLETFNEGTDSYDQAFSEIALESLDFNYSEGTKWHCILGGAQQLPRKMAENISVKPQYHTRVTAIKQVGLMEVSVDTVDSDQKHTKPYNAVFNSTSLGCLAKMDLSKAGLSYRIKRAIRSLSYGPSAKVAIKFSHAWWIHSLGGYSVKMGGLGHSDGYTRTCVYPSYNIYDSKDKTAVLLMSYTWRQDALRLAALMSTDKDHATKVRDEALLKELCINELVKLHRNPEMTDQKLYDLINGSYIDHHAWNWYSDPTTEGAFAFFRPEQFSKMWGDIITPSGDVIIIGEAASPHHAWVVGALESAVHGLHSWLGLNVPLDERFQAAQKVLEDKKPGNPYTGLPPYMDTNISKWHSLLGVIHRGLRLDKQKGEITQDIVEKMKLL